MSSRLALLLFLTVAVNAATVNNDDTCDIAVMPAATLLLPYFEVDIEKGPGEGQTTIFTITNNVNLPQNAHVTLWTDYAYPVIDFNIFLTGYDVQSINLYDVIARGELAPDDGTGSDVSPVGELSGNSYQDILFDNPALDEASCVDLPVVLPQVYRNRLRSAFTTGKVPAAGIVLPACNTAGGVHRNAVGYVTIDVTGFCSTTLPADPKYYASELRFDNVLTGDYIQLDPSQDFAQGGPMVHIRAIPEGGTQQTRAGNPGYKVNMPRTFYSRYLPAGQELSDARQPLPATFYTRWIDGGALGFNTSLKIWREGRSNATTACSAYPAAGRDVGLIELVRFDEEENFEVHAPQQPVTPIIKPLLPAASLAEIGDESIFPPAPGGAASGWMYLNLDVEQHDGYASQNWVISSMRAEDRFAVDVDAVPFGNGCAPALPPSEASFHQPDDAPAIGPAATTEAGCDISTMPAATLLLPYFEVDLSQPSHLAETTIFTISNTSNLPQIAQVTLWTDYAYPVAELSIFLTGYDVHTINLHDLLSRGEIAAPYGTGFDVSPVGELSGPSHVTVFDNPNADEMSCVDLPVHFPASVIARMRAAFTAGKLPRCNRVGGVHRNAVGYATIDVVGACSSLNPTDSNYFDLIRFDNVLTGDYMQLNGWENSAAGGTLVHIRALPGSDLPRTFYSRFQDPSEPIDARQPLPSTFNARWVSGLGARTHYKIWREGRSPASSVCGKFSLNQTLDQVEIVRFDEEENPTTLHITNNFPPFFFSPVFPVTSLTDVDDEDFFPENEDYGLGGWMYLNLDVSPSDGFASQNWVISSMRAESGFSVDIDAAALGNGCSAPVPQTEAVLGYGPPIGPSPNKRP